MPDSQDLTVQTSLGLNRGPRALKVLGVVALVALAFILGRTLQVKGEVAPPPAVVAVVEDPAPPVVRPPLRPVARRGKPGHVTPARTVSVAAPTAVAPAAVAPAVAAPVAVAPTAVAAAAVAPVAAPAAAVPVVAAPVAAVPVAAAPVAAVGPAAVPIAEADASPAPMDLNAWPTPVPVEAEPVLSFDGNGEEIARLIANSRRAAVQQCFERELKRSPELKGTLNVELDLAPPQQVNGVRVSDDLDRPTFTSCVTTAMQRLAFTGLNEEIIVHVPYVLTARAK